MRGFLSVFGMTISLSLNGMGPELLSVSDTETTMGTSPTTSTLKRQVWAVLLV